MRQLIVLSGLLTLASAAQAQVGPTAARVLSKHMPSKAPAAQNFAAEADVVVAADGDVESVNIVTSSGDESFDKQWRKAMSDWKFVPAVDISGQPYESTTRITYKTSGVTYRPADADQATAQNVLGDSARIERMTCKDFLWEYEFVSEALPRRLALLDPLLKTPQVMYATESRADVEQLRAVYERYDQIVNDAARHCRDNPADTFWAGVLKPAMQAPPAN